MKLPISERWDGQNYYVDADGKAISFSKAVSESNRITAEQAGKPSLGSAFNDWPVNTVPSQEGPASGPACAVPLPNDAALAKEFGDPETLLNSRSWLQKAVEAKGAKMIGGGCGCGQADIDIVLEGCKFNISIRPL